VASGSDNGYESLVIMSQTPESTATLIDFERDNPFPQHFSSCFEGRMEWGARIVFELFDRWKKDHFFNNLRFLAVPVLAFQGSLDEDDGKTSRVLFTSFTGLKVLGLSLELYWYIRTHTDWCWIRAL
jgi:hypothetical protein